MSMENKGVGRMWKLLAFPPFLFLIIITAVSVYFGVITRGDAQLIAESVPRSMPLILLIIQLILLPILFKTIRADGLTLSDLGWRLPEGQKWWTDETFYLVLLHGLDDVLCAV